MYNYLKKFSLSLSRLSFMLQLAPRCFFTRTKAHYILCAEVNIIISPARSNFSPFASN